MRIDPVHGGLEIGAVENRESKHPVFKTSGEGLTLSQYIENKIGDMARKSIALKSLLDISPGKALRLYYKALQKSLMDLEG